MLQFYLPSEYTAVASHSYCTSGGQPCDLIGLQGITWPKYCAPIGQNSISNCYKVSPLGILIEEEEENKEEEEEEDESPYIELYSLLRVV